MTMQEGVFDHGVITQRQVSCNVAALLLATNCPVIVKSPSRRTRLIDRAQEEISMLGSRVRDRSDDEVAPRNSEDWIYTDVKK
jgi:hypothetical protein